MPFLPSSQRPDPWQRYERYSPPMRDVTPAYPVPRKSSFSIGAFVFVVSIGVAAGYIGRSVYDAPAPRTVTVPRAEHRAAPAREATAPTRCSDPDGTIHGWQGNGTGITPHDWLHFLPPCDGRR